LLGWLALSFSAAAIGAAASVHAAEFYLNLNRPAWAPPAWLFGPVWTVLYCLMAVAAWQIWRVFGFQRARVALGLFLVQLAVNALWSWVFFVWHLGGWAFVNVLCLIGLVVPTLLAFWRLQPWAGAILLPYLAWISFASVLTYSVWRINPGILT